MKKIAVCLLLSTFCLLLIAARPRPCRTRDECFYQFTFTATPTMTRTAIPIYSPEIFPVSESKRLSGTPHEFPLIDCGDYVAHTCLATSLPPVTAPPAGYP